MLYGGAETVAAASECLFMYAMLAKGRLVYMDLASGKCLFRCSMLGRGRATCVRTGQVLAGLTLGAHAHQLPQHDMLVAAAGLA